MTNYEWLMKEHTELVRKCLRTSESVAVDFNGNVDECGNVKCSNCIFNKSYGCEKTQGEWFDAEHKHYTIPPDTPIDTKVLVSTSGEWWFHRHFAGFNESESRPYLAYNDGKTSWSTGELEPTSWEYCKLAEGSEE